MKLTVASYLKGIPPGNSNPEKPLLLKNFIQGVNAVGDRGILVEDLRYVQTDVAVVQGFVHQNSKTTPHLMLRKTIFENQMSSGNRAIIADSNLFLYADPGNTKTYLRYSYDGVFPNTGEYCNQTPDPARWDKISNNLGLKLKPWRLDKGRYILICCQRDGGWSMNGTDVIPWLHETVQQLKYYSERPIKIRFHPGDKKKIDHLSKMQKLRLPNVTFSKTSHILEDFEKAHAVITYNSSPGVAAAIEGVPTFVLDPERSQAALVSHHTLSDIEKPREFDRELWIQRMAQMHWSLEELKTGDAWRHLRQWAKIGGLNEN